jgi:pilus assembly protein Flp/PilA
LFRPQRREIDSVLVNIVGDLRASISGLARPFPVSDRQGNLRARLAMRTLFLKFAKDESGATAIEYGLIAAGISVAIIATVQTLGTNLKTTFSSVSTALK